MKPIRFTSVILTLIVILSFSLRTLAQDDKIISYIVDPKKQDLQLYWKDDKGQLIQNFENLKNYVAGKNKKLVFAMNGGMFQPDYSPCGLYIQQQQTIRPLVSASGSGNFFFKPNGVFYINKNNTAAICTMATLV